MYVISPVPDTTHCGYLPVMGNRIAELRKRRGLSQTKLADRLGTGRSTIAKLESGEMNLNQRWMNKLAPVLEAAPLDLLGDEETVPLLWRVASAFSAAAPESFEPPTHPRREPAPSRLRRPQDCFAAELLDDSADGLYPPGSMLYCRRVDALEEGLTPGLKVLVRNLAEGPAGSKAATMEVLVGVLDVSHGGDLLLSTRSSRREVTGSLLIQSTARPAGRFAEAPPRLRLVDAPIPYAFEDGDRAEILGVVVMATTPE